MIAGTLKGQRGKDGGGISDSETFVAAPLSRGSNPNSNMAGRRREDDTNLVTGFYPTGGSRDLGDGEVSPPLKVGSGLGIPSGPAIAHALTSQGADASEDGTGRGTPLVAAAVTSKWAKQSGGPSGDEAQNLVAAFSITPEGGQGADLQAVQVDVANTLDSLNAMEHDRGTRIVQSVSVMENQRAEVREGDYTRALAGQGGKAGQGYAAVRQDYTVRRLMPVECERLQGFPDGWTDLGGTKDSPRYAALGDAVTVNVAEWLAHRIAADLRDEL